MAALDLTGAGAGAAEALQEILKQKFLQQQEANKQAQLQVQNQQKQQELQQQQQFQQAQMERMQAQTKAEADERAAIAGVRNVEAAQKLAPELPMGQNVSPQAAGVLKTGGMGGNLFTPPSQAEGENGQPVINSNPEVNLGTPQQQQAQAQRDALGKLITGLQPGSRERQALEYEQATGKPAPAGMFDKSADEPVEQIIGPDGKTPIYVKRSAAIGKTPYHVPPPPQLAIVQTTNDQGQNVTRIVPKVAGSEFTSKADAQAGAQGRAKTEALDTLGQLDQAIDEAKDLIGPGEGRVSNIEQMIGNADPRIQALGVKMKAAKMQADHAISGSMRAGASPTLIKQWDDILGNKVTPEGLHAGVKALREIIQGSGAKTATGAVRKYNPATGKVE